MDNPSGKTGEEFLQSIANSLKALPNIKYLASEVSKLKKASKFATASTSNSYGTGGFVTPPPPTSMTSNKIAFFASDTNWYSNIMAAIMQNEIPAKTQSAPDAKYYFLTNNNSSTSESSVDTCFKSNTAYLSYLVGDHNTRGMLYTANDVNLKYYRNMITDKPNHITRFTVGEDTEISEIRIGDFAGIVSNRNNGSSNPTAALMLGNLYASGSSNYKPYIAKVINNIFTIYRKDSDESFGTGSLPVSEYEDRYPWIFNTSNDKYLGLLMRTPFVVSKGTLYPTWQAAASQSVSNPAGGYQRYTEGINTFFAKNGLSMINATPNTNGNLLVNNEFMISMNSGSPNTTYISQYGDLLLGTMNKPDLMNTGMIGDADRFSLFNRIAFGKSGLATSSNLAVNSNIVSIRAINDGTADSCDNTVSSLPTANADLYRKIYYVNSGVNQGYYRCTKNIYDNTYKWVKIDDGYDHDKRVHWGSNKWSTANFDAATTSQIRFYGPYDASMGYNDEQNIFFDKRIKEGLNFMSIDVTNAKFVSKFSSASYDYMQKLSITSRLNDAPVVTALPAASKSTYGNLVSYNGTYYYCGKTGSTYSWRTVASPSYVARNKALVDFVTNYTVQDEFISELPRYSINLNDITFVDITGSGTSIMGRDNLSINGVSQLGANTASITNLNATQATVSGKIKSTTFENAKGTVQIPNTTDSLITYANNANGTKGAESLRISNGYNGTSRYNFMRITNGEVRYRSKPSENRNISEAMSIVQNSANHMGRKQESGETVIDWIVRPIILTNEAVTESGDWASLVPDGVPIMQYT